MHPSSSHIRQMRMPLHWTALLLGVLAVAPVAAEAALRLYVSYVTKRDHLFRSDAQTGWSNAPNLLTTRINAAGEEWSIRTDQNGQRLIAQNPRARRRILILGNSLSFGEGIDIEDRFDVKMLSSLPGTRVINTGTMGYGTDQEYVAFRNWKHLLESGDTVLIVLNQSDYFDVLRRRFVGRAKPYFEKADGSYVLRPPSIGLWERLERLVFRGLSHRKINRADRLRRTWIPATQSKSSASSSVRSAKKCRAA